MTINPRPGLTKFNLGDDDIKPPTAEQRASAKAEAERIGFTSDAPRTAPRAPVRAATFNTNFHIRTTANDRERFDDFAWRHRITKGEAMTRILDLALAAEAGRDRGDH